MNKKNNNINEENNINLIINSKKLLLQSLYSYKNVKNIDLDIYLNNCVKSSKKIRSTRRFIMANLFTRFSFLPGKLVKK